MPADIGKWVSLGVRFVPFVIQAILNAQKVKDAKGPAKKQAVKDAVEAGVPGLESALEKDVLNDAKVMEATSSYIDAYVALQNAIAASKASKGTGDPK